jgi:Gametolysin peptidase M11
MIPDNSVTGSRTDSVFSAVSTASRVAVLFLVLVISLSAGSLFAQSFQSASVEEEVEGELEILHEDRDVGSRYLYFLKAANRRYSLNFAKDAPTHLTSGAKVRVRGVRTNGVLALQSGGDSVQVLSSALPNTLGEQRTLVILVNFRNNNSQPYTVDFANNVFFGTTSDFFLENSYQQTYLSGIIKGWYTIDMDSPTNTATCDYSLISSLADQAAANAGVVLSDYSRKVYAFPQSGCGWWGLSSVGGTPSRSWINGSLELGVTAHELGHGLGLWHSHSLDCGATAVVGSSCATNEYGDIVDMMGASHSAHYNAFQKERLGWLNSGASPPITTVSSDGTYMLETYQSVGSGPKALKVLKSIDPSTGNRSWYYIESRQAIGFDGFLANEPSQNVLNGVLVHTGTEGNGNSGYLLDMTPATPVYYWWYDPALMVGQTFQDPDTGMTMTTDWVSGTGASVTVSFGAGGPAAVTVVTDQTSYTRNQLVSIKATVRSGSAPVANAAVNFIVKKSNGALVMGTATTGSNGTAVYKLRLTKKDPVGNYEADAAAMSATAATNFMVQ